MDLLPDEIFLKIFQYFSKKEQLRISIVNKRFRRIALSPELWKGNYFTVVKSEETRVALAGRKNNDHCNIIRESKFRYLAIFLQQVTFLKSINLNISIDVQNIDLTNVFNSLSNLECLVLTHPTFHSLHRINFPSTLKHISLYAYNLVDDVLIKVADCCPLLEHVCVITSYPTECGYFKGLDYLLDKSKDTIRSAQFSSLYCTEDSVNFLSKCSHLESLFMDFVKSYKSAAVLAALFNIKNLLLLSINNVGSMSFHLDDIFLTSSDEALLNLKVFCISFSNISSRDFESILSCMPNLEILYLHKCDLDFDQLVHFAKNCQFLKELAIQRVNYDCYTDDKLLQLLQVKLTKNKPFELYINKQRMGMCTKLNKTQTDIVRSYDSSFKLNMVFNSESCLVDIIKKVH